MKERILIVDDQQDIADALARLINVLGYEAKVVYDGREAIKLAAGFAPDMALIDIGMPRLDGYEVAKEIRRQPTGANALLVAVTGWTSREAKYRAYEAGFDLHVAKPLTIDGLKELLSLVDPAAAGSRAGKIYRLQLSKGA